MENKVQKVHFYAKIILKTHHILCDPRVRNPKK